MIIAQTKTSHKAQKPVTLQPQYPATSAVMAELSEQQSGIDDA